jgi:hypothetical protein
MLQRPIAMLPGKFMPQQDSRFEEPNSNWQERIFELLI